MDRVGIYTGKGITEEEVKKIIRGIKRYINVRKGIIEPGNHKKNDLYNFDFITRVANTDTHRFCFYSEYGEDKLVLLAKKVDNTAKPLNTVSITGELSFGHYRLNNMQDEKIFKDMMRIIRKIAPGKVESKMIG